MDFIDDMFNMFGPKSTEDRAFEQAAAVIAHDERSEEPAYASERIIRSAWDHAARSIHDPSSIARSLPWDAFAREINRGELSAAESWVWESQKPVGYLDRILDSIVLWDSELGYTGNRARNLDSDEEEEDYESDEDFQDEDEDENGFDDDMIVDDEQEAITAKQRLDGQQLYPDHFVDRFLPGVLINHPCDNRPTNAIAWDISPDPQGWDDDWEHYKELSRTHPGDDVRDHENFSQKGSSARDYEEESYCPVVTKAGSRLWSISFVAPAESKESSASCVDMKASYPCQLTIRYDIGRNLLIYDMFDFHPINVKEFKQQYSESQNDLCTESELAEVESLLRSTRRNRAVASSFMHMSMGIEPSVGQECLSTENTMQERIQAIGIVKCCHLLNYIRFRKCRLMRVRFPLHGLRGARLIEFDCQRPNDDLPAAKGRHPLSRLGGPGEMGTAPGHNSFEKSDDKIEPLGMLVLEFGDTCANFVSGDKNSTILNKHPYASTVAHPKHWQERMRLPYDGDWTPDQAFSKSRRHYIVGDMSEMLELANFLISKNSYVRNALILPPGNQHPSARKVLNSLSGDASVLSLSATPIDKFISFIKVNEESATSRCTLKSLCVDALLGSSTLQETKRRTRQFETEEDVNEFLRRCGIGYPDGVNMCLKAALLNDKLKVPEQFLHGEDASGWLGTELLSGECSRCKKLMTCSIRQVLYQDHCASESREDYDRAPIKCGGFLCSGKYVTAICRGMPRFDRDNHNHCTECPGFGCCIGYWRNNHCEECGGHYITGKRCKGCKAKKVVDAYLQAKPSGDENAPPDAKSWDGLIEGCDKFDLRQDENKKQFIGIIRRSLVMLHSTRAARGGDYEQFDERLREHLNLCPFPFSAEKVDDIVENHCRANLEDMSMFEVTWVTHCVNNLLEEEYDDYMIHDTRLSVD